MNADEWDRRFAELKSGVTDLERKIEALTAPAAPESVSVSAELVEALADLFYHWDNACENGIAFDVQRFVPAARALVDAVERPNEDEGRPAGKSQGVASAGEPPEMSDALTALGTRENYERGYAEGHAYRPPRPPISDEAEAWVTWHNANIERLWELEGRERDEALFLAGFRAARQEKA